MCVVGVETADTAPSPSPCAGSIPRASSTVLDVAHSCLSSTEMVVSSAIPGSTTSASLTSAAVIPRVSEKVLLAHGLGGLVWIGVASREGDESQRERETSHTHAELGPPTQTTDTDTDNKYPYLNSSLVFLLASSTEPMSW